MRDKMLKRVDTDAISAEHLISSPLTVSDTLRANEVICGRLIIQSQSGRPAVTIAEDPQSRSGRIETYNKEGEITGVLGTQPTNFLPKWLWLRQPSSKGGANRYPQQPTQPPGGKTGAGRPETTKGEPK